MKFDRAMKYLLTEKNYTENPGMEKDSTFK